MFEAVLESDKLYIKKRVAFYYQKIVTVLKAAKVRLIAVTDTTLSLLYQRRV